MTHALIVGGREQTHGQPFFLRDGARDVAHRLEHCRHREGDGLLVHQLVTALRELDDVARDGGKAKRRRVDQAELAALHVVDHTALTTLQRLGQDEDRRERRAQIVRHVHQQREPVGSREVLCERLRPARFDRDAHPLDRDEQGQQLRIGSAAVAPPLDDLVS